MILNWFPRIQDSSLIAAVSFLSAMIEIYGFAKDRKSKDEAQTVRNANQTSNGPGSIPQQFESFEGQQTNVAGGSQGDVLSGQFNGPASSGGDAADMRDSNGPIYKPSGPVTLHFGPEIVKPNEPLPVPRIRSPPQDFVGRIEELRMLLGSLDQGATITGLRGMGGIGKTALALVLADKLKDRFKDGQIFLKLEGTSQNPLKTADAMAQVIRAFRGSEERLPEDQNELQNLYNSVLAGKNVLLLLDNALVREQVEPLLPPKGCAVIITSRNKFDLPGLQEKDLDVLPLDDAKKLLLQIAERIGDRAEDLAKLCGCLPIALRNAAYALKERKDLGVAEYLERLQEARNRVEPDESRNYWILFTLFEKKRYISRTLSFRTYLNFFITTAFAF